jgi:hypothetical protein
MSAIIEATLNQSYKIEVEIVGNVTYFDELSLPPHQHNINDVTFTDTQYNSYTEILNS